MAAPSLTGLDPVAFDENDVNAGPRLIDSDVTLTDAEGDFDGGRLIVTGMLAEDTVSIETSGLISYDGSTGEVSYNGVVIGIASGGAGGTFQVVFDADTTTAGVEAVIEHLTYANSSDTPTAVRNLSIDVIDASGEGLLQPTFNSVTPSGLTAGSRQITFADLDGDGDLDLISSPHSQLEYYRNDGTDEAPVFTRVLGAGNPLPTISGLSYLKPELVDIDGDGDMDMFVGVRDVNTGRILLYRNEGTDSAPVFVQDTANNPFAGVEHSSRATLTFGDLDGDGDLDLVLGGRNGLNYMENIGTATAPVYVARTGPASPVNGLTGASFTTPALGDIDNDGDLDLLVGHAGHDMIYYENIGTAQIPSFVQRTLSVPMPGFGYVQPTLADLDGDGLLDIVYSTSGLTGTRIIYNDAALPSIPVTVNAQFDPTAGADDLIGGATGEFIEGLDGDDYIDGGAGNDTIEGGDGADYLKGGAGDDILRGGNGNDTYVVDSLGDTVDETGGDGIDLVHSRVSWTLGAGLENLTLGAGGRDTNGTGNALDNIITGNAFANTLSGMDGSDTLLGDGGNDTLHGGAGIDLLSGGNGNDLLDGGTGADQMSGGLGNDTYVVDDFGDMIDELAGQGIDTIETTLNGFSLVTFGQVENLTLTGALGQFAEGNALGNVIKGSAGGDLLNGLDGADTLYGNDGDDALLGGVGADKLYGGSGADGFHFESADDLQGDRIFDLNFAQGDTIVLTGLDADTTQDGDQAIVFVDRFTKVAGQATLVYAAASDVTYLRLDLDGDGRHDVQMSLVGDHSGSKGNLWTGQDDTNGGWVL